MERDRIEEIALGLHFAKTPKDSPHRQGRKEMALRDDVNSMEAKTEQLGNPDFAKVAFLYVTIVTLLTHGEDHLVIKRTKAKTGKEIANALVELVKYRVNFSCIVFDVHDVEVSFTFDELEEYANELMKLEIDPETRHVRTKK